MVDGGARYEQTSNRYMERRQLSGNANPLMLWGMGIAAVIVGEFSGWNYGLAAGGFWGMALATILMAVMYLCVVYSIAELSVMFPHTGGLYSFARNAFGPFLGFLCGLMLIVEFIPGTAVILINITDYFKLAFPDLNPFSYYLLWVVVEAIFIGINIWSTSLTFSIALFLSLGSILVLCIFYLSMTISGVFNPALLFNIPADAGQSMYWLPKGWTGIFAAIPYAIWFYIAIEQLPMAAEETRNVATDMPKALVRGMFALIVLSLLTLILNSGVGGGASEISQSGIPLVVGYEAYFGKGAAGNVVSSLMLAVGSFASFHAGTYAYGRVLFSLSRAGYLPRWISRTNNKHTPYYAIALGAAVGLTCLAIIDRFENVGQILIYLSVFAGLFSYIIVMFGYIKLKRTRSDLPRAYQSPWGIRGAAVGAGLAIFALIACLLVPDYQPSFWGIGGFTAVGAIYYWLYGRHRLVAQAPEEKAALLAEARSIPGEEPSY